MMCIFLILVSLGLVFTVYAFVQFFREGKRRTNNRQHSSNPNTGKRRPDSCSEWIQYSRRESILLPKDTPPNGVMVMGKFRSGLLALHRHRNGDGGPDSGSAAKPDEAR